MKITVNVFLIFLIIKDLYHELTIFQQSSYKTKNYFKHFKRYYLGNIKSYIKLTLLICLIIYNFLATWYIGMINLFLISGDYLLFNKKILKLKYTKRLIRLITTTSLLIILLTIINSSLLSICYYLIPFVIILSNVINKPIELIINKYYLNKANKKLNKIKPFKIGITGSFGKTSTKNFLYEILKDHYLTHMTPKSYNTLMGVSKDILLNLKGTEEIYISELGATMPNDINKLNKLLNINYGVITSIGTQHLESFKTLDNIIKTKLEILNSEEISTIFINADNEALDKYNYPKDLKVIRVGINNKNVDYQASILNESFNNLSFVLNNKWIIYTKLNGKHNVINLLLCIAIGVEMGLDIDKIVESIALIEPVEHRQSIMKFDKYQIIDDSFNSNYIGFINALDTLKQTNTFKILITPGIVEQDKMLKKYYKTISLKIKDSTNLTYIIDNPNSKELVKSLKEVNYHNYLIVYSLKEAITLINELQINQYITILIENDLTDYYLTRG